LIVPDILDLRDVADEWQEMLDEMGGNVPNTEGMSWGEVADATSAFLAEPEQAEQLAKYVELCGELGCEPTPDDLRKWANDYDPTLIEDDYFEEYARDLADELGMNIDAQSWPLTYINWERAAEALQMDYSSVEYDGDTYYYRS
jgi:hypothetical protein